MGETYWQVGRHIVEFEQGGAARAEYGQGLLKKLARDLRLTPAQVAELRRMTGSERSYGRAAAQVLGREEAAHLNTKLAAMRAEKDRKARLALGGSYPAFREWVRAWWNAEVSGSQSRSRFR